MTPLRKRTIDYMVVKGYAEATKRAYLYQIQEFAKYFNTCPSKLGETEVLEYLRHLREDRGLSKSQINCAYSGIKMLFVSVLDKPWHTQLLPRPRKEKKLPTIFSINQVKSLIDQTNNIKHRTILMLTYCAGLRLSEVVQLRVGDIIPSRQRLLIRQSKGAKDRYSILSERMLIQLKEYQYCYRPHDWLFVGADVRKPISRTTVQIIYKQAKKRVKLPAQGGLHQLRHCFATHAIESGMDVSSLQKLLGHSSLRATAIYLHLKNDDLSNFQHPLDQD